MMDHAALAVRSRSVTAPTDSATELLARKTVHVCRGHSDDGQRSRLVLLTCDDELKCAIYYRRRSFELLATNDGC